MRVGSLILIILFLSSMAMAEDMTYIDEKGKVICDIDKVDYFIVNGRRVTWSGVIDTIIQERKDKFISELKKEWRGLFK